MRLINQWIMILLFSAAVISTILFALNNPEQSFIEDNKPYSVEYQHIVLNDDNSFISQISHKNTIYIIRNNYDLEGKRVVFPQGSILKFEGGILMNGTLIGNNTVIEAPICKIFETNIKIEGSWSVNDSYPEWFGAQGDGKSDDYMSIRLCIASFPTTVLGNKTYYVGHTIFFKDLLEKKIVGQGNNRLNGPGTTIKTNMDTPVFHIVHGINFTFENLLIVGPGETNGLFKTKWNSLKGKAFLLGDIENPETGRCFAWNMRNVTVQLFETGIYAPYSWNFTLEMVKYHLCNYGMIIKSGTCSTLTDCVFYECKVGFQSYGGDYSSLINVGFDQCEIGVDLPGEGNLSLIKCGWEWTTSFEAKHTSYIRSSGKNHIILEAPSISYAPATQRGDKFIELTAPGSNRKPIIITNPSWGRLLNGKEEPYKSLHFLSIITPPGSEVGCIQIINPCGESLIREDIYENPCILIKDGVINKNLLPYHSVMDKINIENSGAILKPNYDGTYTLSGRQSTPTRQIIIASFNIVKGNVYRLSGAPKGTSVNKAWLAIEYPGRPKGESIYSFDGNVAEFTAAVSTTAQCVLYTNRVYDNSGNPASFNNIIFSPMVTLKDVGTDKFEPYQYTPDEYNKYFNGISKGDSSDRPKLGDDQAGYQFFDKTLGKPIWWNGKNWVDATGASI